MASGLVGIFLLVLSQPALLLDSSNIGYYRDERRRKRRERLIKYSRKEKGDSYDVSKCYKEGLLKRNECMDHNDKKRSGTL